MIYRRGLVLLKSLHRSINLAKRSPLTESFVTASSVAKFKNKKIKDVKDSEDKYGDTFGNLNFVEVRALRIKDDPEDIEEYKREKKAKGKKISEYITEIKSCLDDHNYEKAIEILEVDMVNDRKRRVSHIYDMLVSYNGKIGNLKEAYRLYTAFKRRQGYPSGGMYTSLFNACANCDDSRYALDKADKIVNYLRNSKHHKLNIKNYHAMLKAYGRHGDLATVMKLLDEIIHTQKVVRSSSYSFVFQGCISDKNSGLRHALILWRKMIQQKVKPSLYVFAALLKCTRECALGDIGLLDDFLKEIETENKKVPKEWAFIKRIRGEVEKPKEILTISECFNSPTQLLSESHSEIGKTSSLEYTPPLIDNSSNIESNEDDKLNVKLEETININEPLVTAINNPLEFESKLSKVDGSLVESKAEYLPQPSDVPNLLEFDSSHGSPTILRHLIAPHEKFMLLGGLKGFLKVMSDFQCQPNLNIFTHLLTLSPPNKEAEEELLAQAKAYNVKLDTTVYNILIQRGLKYGHSIPMDVLQLMRKEEISPDLITFGLLAQTCKTEELGMSLIKSARNFGIRVNSIILTTLLKNAKTHQDASYVNYILQVAKEEETELDPKFLASLKRYITTVKKQNKELLRKSREFASDPTQINN